MLRSRTDRYRNDDEPPHRTVHLSQGGEVARECASMRAGEGLGGIKLAQDRRQHSLKVLVDVTVRDSDHVKPKSLKLLRSSLVPRHVFSRRMRSAVDLDDQLAIKRDEIDDVARDHVLAPKLPAAKLTSPQRPP